MYRLTAFNRVVAGAGAGGAGARSAGLARIRLASSKITETSIGNDADAAQDKSHQDAISANQKETDAGQKHSLDRSNDARGAQDLHTEAVTAAAEQKDGKSDSGSAGDAVNMAHGKSTGASEAQRKAAATPEGSGYQPGQKGDQVGGGFGGHEGQQAGEGMGAKEEAPVAGTFKGAGQFVKNVIGKGPSAGSGFHTYARLRYPSSVPEEAVDKGARKPKDTGTGAEQTQHLPHHPAGEGDKMPAVKDNASLPSKKGNIDGDKKKPVKASGNQTNAGQGPAMEKRPTGTATAPGSRAVDPKSGIHSPSFAPNAGPSATYTHIIGTPEPDSYQTSYQYSSSTSGGGVPSGSAPRSSTSASPYSAVVDKLPKNEAGIGSSNKMIRDPLKGADEMVAQMDKSGTMPEPGQAGDDAGRGEAVGQVGGLNQPPDVGTIPEDTLPKPIK